MTSIPTDDPELTAMAQVLKTLESIQSSEAQQRVIDWVIVRLGLSKSPANKKFSLPMRQSDNPGTNDETITREGTINTVANKLDANSCRTLLVASAAYLTLYQGKEKFSREELVSCAKQARLWKNDYSTQTSVNINRMCDAGELIEKSKDVYDLSPKKLAELDQELSE